MSTRRSSWYLALATVFTLGGGAVAQQAPAAHTLSVATLAPSGSTWMRGLEAANRELRRRTNGAVALRFYPGGVQGDESEVVRKMRQGRLDGAVLTGVGLGQVHRPVLAFMLPNIFPNHAAMERSRTALSGEVERQFLANNFVLAAWGDTGTPRLFSQREIHTPHDLQALHPWIWRDDVILPALYGEAGAHGVPLALPEVLSALQTNRIDTFIAPPLAALALQWSTRATFVSEGANSFGLGGIVFTRHAWESIPADQQAIGRQVVQEFNALIGRNVTRDDENALHAMTTRGMHQMSFTEAERGQWAQLFERTRHRLVGTVSDAAWMERVRVGH